jgi:hypothetical protein
VIYIEDKGKREEQPKDSKYRVNKRIASVRTVKPSAAD